MDYFKSKKDKMNIAFSRVINGKRYDTKTARSVGYNYRTGSCYDDLYYEELFKKSTGEFFLYVKYVLANLWNIDGYSNKEYIKPLTREESMAWAEKYADADAFIEAFGYVAE